ncbi:MAG: NPCBM/NEW2 domain-containing protein [Thermoguttaceae bacterium]|nr:NPCBM/NEW2 domain-containing protein [Thermoguttaceae bacterium]
MRRIILLLTFASAALFGVGAPAQAQSFSRHLPHLVVLMDGTVIPCAVTSLTKEEVQLTRLSKPEQMTIPYSSLAGIVFSRPVPDEAEEALVNRDIHKASPTDLIIDAAGKSYSGGFFEGLDGFVLKYHSITHHGDQTIPLVQIRALICHKKVFFVNHHRWVFTTKDGAIFFANSMKTKNGVVTVKFPWSETRYEFDESEIVRALPPVNVGWLDELGPDDWAQIPFWSAPSKSHRDNADVNGGRLRANTGQYYLHGFGVAASSRLTFKLTDLGNLLLNKILPMPDVHLTGYAARPYGVKTGSVRFRVFTDGALAGTWTLSATDAPVKIDIPLNGKKRLDLVVDFADDSPVDDRAIWGEMKIEAINKKQ